MNNELSQKIMQGVCFVFVMKRFVLPVSFKVAVFVASAGALWSFVSLRDVVANMPGLDHAGSVMSFMLSAFASTEFAVQVTLVAMGLFFIWLMRDFAKNFTFRFGVAS